MQNTLVAFNSDTNLKTMLLEEVENHRKADQIIQGTYGKDVDGKWKGCAVGCSIHSLNIKLGKEYATDDHSVYPKEIGIPETIAYLEDCIFEGLPKKKAVLWPERFFKAIKPGADLSLVTPKFMVWVMEDVKQYAKDLPDVLKVIETVQSLYQRIIDGGTVSDYEWNRAAEAAAWAAAWAAARAAAEAARAAKYEEVADKLIELLSEAR
jgi:hypothetical protein